MASDSTRHEAELCNYTLTSHKMKFSLRSANKCTFFSFQEWGGGLGLQINEFLQAQLTLVSDH